MRWTALLMLIACDPEVADILTEPAPTLPDVTGLYDVTMLEVEGCTDADLSWMQGELEITGDATELSMEFPGGVLIGVVDEAYALDAEGTVEPVDREVDAVFQGVVVLGDDGWDLDGDVLADVIDSTDDTIACTLSGRMEAQQRP